MFPSHDPGHTNEDNIATIKEYMRVNDIKYKEIKSMYENTPEVSFIVSESKRDFVHAVMKSFNQHSILKVHNDATATLYFKDGSIHELGVFKAVDSHTASQNAAYSIIDGQHYIID